jgi:hypothetical protein
MTLTSRALGGLILASTLLTAWSVVAAQRPGFAGPAPWASGVRPGPQTELLVPGDHEAEARGRTKDEVIRRLLDGRLTLPEAAAWFRSVNRPSRTGVDLLARYPGASEEERLCRQVIAWAKARAESQSFSQAEVVGQRLEAELRACLEREGKVRLPEV